MKRENNQTRFVVVTGGVISGVGKGVAAGSIGKILKESGFNTTLIKIDPYLNCDAGTLRPTEHGEVWVTEDGGEIDQDLGTYERFMDINIPKKNNITSGQVYKTIINRERSGKYLGKTVQFIPHVIDEIRHRITQATVGYDVAVVEIGGTVGDYENIPFLFAIKTLERDIGRNCIAHVLVTYLPVPNHIDEMKTKPTQQAIRLLGEQGIAPDFIICRSKYSLDMIRRKKIEEFVHLPSKNIIAAPDVSSVYRMPLEFIQQALDKNLFQCLGLEQKREPDWSRWRRSVNNIERPAQTVKIAIVGKYIASGACTMADSYTSICHALTHAGADINVGITVTWINAVQFEQEETSLDILSTFDGILIPGGFGGVGVDGKMKSIGYARTKPIPLLGLCYGLQLSVIEFARSVCNLDGAHTTEVDPETPHPIIDILPTQREVLQSSRYGGSMRLGAYKATIKPGTIVSQLYNERTNRSDSCAVSERHRHRYEVNPDYVSVLEQRGFIFSGVHTRSDGTNLMEFGELDRHPFFVVTQAHPEFKSRLGRPTPLFLGFIRACVRGKSDFTVVKKKQVHVYTQS